MVLKSQLAYNHAHNDHESRSSCRAALFSTLPLATIRHPGQIVVVGCPILYGSEINIKKSMTSNFTAILHTNDDPTRACKLDPSVSNNAKILRPLAQMIQQLEANRKAFSYRSAIAQRYIDADLFIQLENSSITKRFREVVIDMSSGRVPRLVFVGKKFVNDDLAVALSFDTATEMDWLKPRKDAECTWCGPGYQCAACKEINASQPA